jgi:hypothetical protein
MSDKVYICCKCRVNDGERYCNTCQHFFCESCFCEHWQVEKLAAQFHEIYQAEAKRQGDVRHKDKYEDLPENIKEFDRVLVQFVLNQFGSKEEHAALLKIAEAAQEVSDRIFEREVYYEPHKNLLAALATWQALKRKEKRDA